nr:ribonuclease H-like domain-containing protein [Tanacetum cinerariifolium]
MESLSPQVVSTAKLPILNPNEFDLWKMRIEQYFLMTDYSLWEVILNGDSPIPTRVIDGVVQLVAPTTAEQRLARKNELKARGTLLIALLNKHQLKFNIHKDAKTLMEAIEKRLQKLISQLEILEESLSQEDINLKFLRSLLTEWRTQTLIKRNKTDLEDQSLDDLFNSPKIYKAEVKSSSTTSTTTQNIAFVSYQNTDSTNESVSVVASVFAASTKVLVSALPNVDTLSDAAEEEPTNYTLMAFTSSSSSSSDNEVASCSKACTKAYATLQSHYDKLTNDLRKSQFNVLSYKTGLESVKPRIVVYQQNETVFEEDIKLLKLDVMLRDNALADLRKKFEKVEQERDERRVSCCSSSLYKNIYASKPDLVFHDALTINETVHTAFNVEPSTTKPTQDLSQSIGPLSLSLKIRFLTQKINMRHVKNHTLRGNHQHYARMTHPNPQRHVVPTAVLTRSRLVLLSAARPVNTGVSQTKVHHQRPTKHGVNKAHSPKRRPINLRPSPPASNFHQKVKLLRLPRLMLFKVSRETGYGNLNGNPQHALKDKGVIDSGCSRHMIKNMSYLSDFKEINGGYVTFGGNPKGGKITGKGKTRTGKLDFDDVYFVKELKFNLFSVS